MTDNNNHKPTGWHAIGNDAVSQAEMHLIVHDIKQSVLADLDKLVGRKIKVTLKKK